MILAILPPWAKKALPEVSDEYFFDIETFAENQEAFLELCKAAKKIIMWPWLRTKEVADNPNSLIAAKKLAEKIIDKCPGIEIFALLYGGIYDTPIHNTKGVRPLISFTDPILKYAPL